MQNEANEPLDLAAIRARLAGAKGPEYWQSLEELAGTPVFQEFVEDEFPDRASLLQIDRRQFLTVMGASLAMAGLSGCRKPFMAQEKIVPYVKAPEELVYGRPLMFATAMTLGGFARGVLVESHEGRPTKIEGNPQHPASRGATDVWMQASILTLYDPDRSQSVLSGGEIGNWDAFLQAARPALRRARPGGVRLLTETVTSPTLAAEIRAFLQQFPGARWHQYEPVNRDSVRAGAIQAFGTAVDPVYRLGEADVILSLDADFLHAMPGSVRYARDFSEGRRIRRGQTGMNRLYAAESAPTITGASADHQFALRPSQIEPFARAVAGALGVSGAGGGEPGVDASVITAIARDLQASRGRSLVIAGDSQPAAVHVLAHAMNAALGNVGRTVVYVEPVAAEPTDQMQSLRELVTAMNDGRVDVLVILSSNPAYDTPADLRFAEAMTARSGSRDRVPLRIHHGLYADETAALCQWHIPEAHYLEAWGDARAYDGTVSIIQPLIQPLYDGRAATELVSALAGQPRGDYEIVYEHWRGQRPAAGFEKFWQKAVHDGVVPNTASPVRAVTIAAGALATTPAASPAGQEMELILQPDPNIWDGRFANNAWLQEVPKPLTKLSWDNAALVSPRTAQERGLNQEELITLTFKGRTLSAPVWIVPGHPDNAVSLSLGYGRTRAGTVGTGTGFNAYALRTSDALWGGPGLQIAATGEKYPLATTQYQQNLSDPEIEKRDIVLSDTIQNFRARNGNIGFESQHGADTAADEQHGALQQGGAPPESDITQRDVANRESGIGVPSVGGVPNVGDEPPQAHEPAGDTVQADPYRGEWRYRKEGNLGGAEAGHPSLMPEYDYSNQYAWGMTIDLNTCIGCNACSVACYAENNIAVVGKYQVQRGRIMHWIRIDHYFKGSIDNPQHAFQPLPCMHCEKAPCEPVCPVAATVHSHEGLNQMIYNRCVGTRYCSNNCPYKVRRFNFLKYAAGKGGPRTLNFDLPVLQMLHNPDVSIRGRGVMEKCTYCVQRINQARIEAKREDRRIRDGEVVPACAQACPTRAILFGDINDPNSVVARSKAQPHNYSLLDELNTQPRTTYLAKLRNPNPDLETA